MTRVILALFRAASRRPWLAARISWSACAVGVLGWALYAYDGTPNFDGDTALAISMTLLSFPTGAAATVVMGETLHHLYLCCGVVLRTTRLEMAATWAVLFVVGYFQWFWALPRVAKRLAAARAQRLEFDLRSRSTDVEPSASRHGNDA